MVYKIRNKSIFWTRAGWKNNWHPKNFNAPKPTNAENTMGMRCRYDHHSFLRATQTYRNLSRHCKQYFYGDKKLEEVFIMGLRSFFYIPMVSECLTDQIKHGGERRMVDQLDRDFELVSYNQHPFQLFTYEVNNRKLAREQENYETKVKGGQTGAQTILAYADEVIAKEKQQIGEGQSISTERLTEIMLHILRKYRSGEGRPSEDSRDASGEFNDYLEKRRPFMEPNPDSHAH